MCRRIFAELFRELEVAKTIIAQNPVASCPGETEDANKNHSGRAGENGVYPPGKSHRKTRDRAAEQRQGVLTECSLAKRLLDPFAQLTALEATAEIIDRLRDSFFKLDLR